MVRFYEGADGLKTGFTDNAGYCMAVTALKDNMRLIAVVLGEASGKVRNSEAMELLYYGYNLYKVDLIKIKDDVIYLNKALEKYKIENNKLMNEIDLLLTENDNLKNELEKYKKIINNMQNQQQNINNNDEIKKLKDEIKLKEDKINIEKINSTNKNRKIWKSITNLML